MCTITAFLSIEQLPLLHVYQSILRVTDCGADAACPALCVWHCLMYVLFVCLALAHKHSSPTCTVLQTQRTHVHCTTNAVYPYASYTTMVYSYALYHHMHRTQSGVHTFSDFWGTVGDTERCTNSERGGHCMGVHAQASINSAPGIPSLCTFTLALH